MNTNFLESCGVHTLLTTTLVVCGVSPANKRSDWARFGLLDAFLVLVAHVFLYGVSGWVEALWLHADAIVDIGWKAEVGHLSHSLRRGEGLENVLGEQLGSV